MPDGIELRDYACPKCGETVRLDARFIQWCTACGHGADPKPPEWTKREQRRYAREYDRSWQLFESLRTARSLRPTSVTGVSVTLLSGVVHLISLAVLVLPTLLVLATRGAVWAFVVLGFCLMTFAVVRPRFPKRRRDNGTSLDRTTAPKFYELLDRCAAELGCPVPDRVEFGLEFNASTGRSGIRQRSHLVIGVPLWSVLSGRGRIALLGHELAHQINGDTTHNQWAVSARRSLHEWTKLLDPQQTGYERFANTRNVWGVRWKGGTAGGLGALLAPIFMAVLFLPLFLITIGCQTLLTRLDLYCGQRAEYLADEYGARLAGSEAAFGLLIELTISEVARNFVTAAKNRPKAQRDAAADGLWARLTDYMDSIPETERQRRTLVDRLHNTRTDRSHPANHLRIALIAARPQLPGVLKLSEDEWAAIDAELAPGYLDAARRLVASR